MARARAGNQEEGPDGVTNDCPRHWPGLYSLEVTTQRLQAADAVSYDSCL